jgi:hypothetical protein
MRKAAFVFSMLAVSVLGACLPILVQANHKSKPIPLLTPHPADGQEMVKGYPGNPAIPRGLIERRGTVVAGVSYVQLWPRKPTGHYDCGIHILVANEDPQKELSVRQDHFFAHDAETGRYWALLTEENERAILDNSGQSRYVPQPPPPSYTVRNSDGSTSTITPDSDGLAEVIANAIARRQYEKFQEKRLQDLDTHFHDALLEPQKATSGWLHILGVTLDHPLRIVLYIGGERFVFIFGPDSQEYVPDEKKGGKS